MTETAQDVPSDGRTGLICLVEVATNHGLSTSVERLIHDHALDAGEPNLGQLESLARATGLKARIRNITPDRLVELHGVFPLIVRLSNGNYIVVVGTNESEDGHPNVVIFDPLAGSQGFMAVPLTDFTELWDGSVLLLKRSYALTDASQPFGLMWFVPEILKNKRIFRDVAIAALALHVLGLFTPIFFQLVIDKVLVHQSFSTLWVLTIGISVALLFEAGFGFLRQYLLLFATNKIDIRMVTKTFSHLLALPISFFERASAGVTVRHMQQVEKIREFLTGQLFLTALDATVLFIYVPVLLFYSPQLTAMVMGFTVAIALVILALIGPFRRRLQALYNAEAERQAMLVESIAGAQTIKTLALEPRQRKTWDQRSASAVNAHFGVGKISITAGAATGLLEKLMSVSIIAFGAYLVFGNELSVGALIAFNMLSARVVTPLVKIVSLIHEYQETALSVRMLGTVMNHPPERAPGQSGIRPELSGAVDFENVTFQYTPGTKPVLDDITLSLPAGQVIGIVGKSGSGKSTMAKLIQGLYPLHHGVIRLDGYDIREMDLDYLRRSIGVVLQDNFLFKATVRENIALTMPGATLEQVVAAARISGADEFIEKLPQGFDTPLEENGSNLSGGQKQRLAIARAVLKQPRLLLLDEATSALDPDTEAIFMDNLADIAKNRTVIIISHRLSTLMECDTILVMDDGRIVDSGTHPQLVERCAIYKHLWHQQNRHL